MPALFVRAGAVKVAGDAVRRVSLPARTLRLGRSRDNDVQLDDPRVSRRQFELESDGVGGGRLRLLDGSAPLYVNGEVVAGVRELVHGDLVVVAQIELEVGRDSSDLASLATSTVAGETLSGVLRATTLGADAISERYLLVLGELGDSLRQIDDPEAVRRRLLATVRGALPVTRAMIALLPEGGDRLSVVAWDVDDEDPAGSRLFFRRHGWQWSHSLQQDPRFALWILAGRMPALPGKS